MNMNLILNALYIAAMIALGGIALWCKGNGTIRGLAASLIAEAEGVYKDAAKAGGIKFEWVVNRLYAAIPAPLQPFMPRAVIEALVQATFDAVESYARLQLDKGVDKITSGEEVTHR